MDWREPRAPANTLLKRYSNRTASVLDCTRAFGHAACGSGILVSRGVIEGNCDGIVEGHYAGAGPYRGKLGVGKSGGGKRVVDEGISYVAKTGSVC